MAGGGISLAMIVLFTDFGLAGPYTGQVDAVLQRDRAESAGDPPVCRCAGGTAAAGGVICWRHMRRGFRPARVLLCVVDPGVGGARRAVIVEAEAGAMSGPTTVCSSWCCGGPRRRGVGRSPGGRRACRRAFTAATCSPRLRRGWRAASPRRRAGAPRRRSRRPDWPDDLPEIVYVDHYGNALTGLRGDCLPADAASAPAGGRSAMPRPSRGAAGEPFWYVNSNGLIEIAVNGGRADRTLAPRDRQRGLDRGVKSHASGRRQHRLDAGRQPEVASRAAADAAARRRRRSPQTPPA